MIGHHVRIGRERGRRFLSSALTVAGLVLVMPQPAVAGPSILFEAQTGKVLYAEDVGQAWHPASLTKLMTAYIAFEAIKAGRLSLDEQLVCSEAAAKAVPSKVGLKPGQTISVDLALRALVIKSANDMAVVLAERIGGSEAEFVTLMNATAARLGMKATRFANPNGLPDPTQVTTARDLAQLATAIVRDHPEYAELFASSSVTIGKAKLTSHNRLLQTFQGADGLKTGFICDSGYNIVASATRDGKRLIAVVLGATSAAARNVRAAAMLEYGFQNLDWKMASETRTLATIANAPTDTAVPMQIRSSVMNWSCGWRPPKGATAADGEEADPPPRKRGPKPKKLVKAAAKPKATTEATSPIAPKPAQPTTN